MRPSRRPVSVVVILVALLASLVTPVAANDSVAGPVPAGTDAAAQNSWIVTLEPGADPAGQAAGLARGANGRVGHIYEHALTGFQFRGSERAAAALARSPRVASVQPDGPLTLSETLPFGIERVAAYGLGGVVGAYQAGFRGNGARIAILDTGIDLDHPELAASIDAALGLNCMTSGAEPNDGYGHGTHVAGTAAAPINGVGVAGVAPQARLVAVKMFTDAGASSEAAALCAIDHIVGLNTDGDASNDIDVANMSWGESRAAGSCETDALHAAICQAYAAGIILVGGAGNSGNTGTFVPAAYPEVINVSAIADFDGERGRLAGCGLVTDLLATECDDTFAFFSNRGPAIDVTAPGVRIYSSWAGGTWRTSSGTSMATPHVAGIAALMAAAAPGLTPAAARDILLSSGECPNGQAADADGVAGCAGQGTWPDDTDGIPEPMAHALRAAQAAAAGVADPEAPAAPVLSATGNPASIDLSWTAPDDGGSAITGYDIQRRSPGGAWQDLATGVSGLGYSDSAVLPGETWHYQARAVNEVGAGPWSNEAVASVPVGPEAPGAPVLAATATATSVDLSWTEPDDGGSAITGYDIQRRSPGGAWEDLATGLSGVGYSDTAVLPGETWHYQVRAVNAEGNGAWSNEAVATVPTPAEAPSAPSLSATRGDRQVRLEWTAPADDGGAAVTNYAIWRRSGTSAATLIATVGDVRAYTNTGLTNGTTYWYTVTAINSVGPGAPSNEVSATPATRPSAPRSLKAQKAVGSITLTWAAPSSTGGAPLISYRIYRTGGPSTVTVIVPATQLTYTDLSPVSGTWYAYVVSAINAAGESPASNIVTVKAQ